ncbi:MAG: fumarylacetoacetate hydrolase family protein [candidate division Zixibacteria bacterium]|nr:fumarylacetoacetate hydrolase family protein [candidate division Zixibacteria bacterium]
MSIKKYCRLMHSGKPVWGLVTGETIQIMEGDLFGQFSTTDQMAALAGTKLLPPVTPTKIVCVGLNYADHVKESQSSSVVPQEPVLFMKPLTALIGPEDTIVAPVQSQRVDYEGEIGVVIGARCKDLSPEEVAKNIFGVTCVNDVTARDLQKKDLQWTRGKGFDTFCPVGPYLVTGLDCKNLNVTSRLNGETRQTSNSRNMIFSIAELISFVNHIMTLLPGDLIATGTPEGVGPMKNGDIIEVEVESVGVLRNRVQRNG